MAQPYPLPRETRETAELVTDGSAVYGPFAFRIFDAADVAVFLRPATGEDWVPAAGATVEKITGAAFDHFRVRFAPSPPPGHRLVVQGVRLHERWTEVTRGGVLSADRHEAELSRMGAVLQELRRDVDSLRERAWGVPHGDEPQRLPPLHERATGGFLGFDTAGRPTVRPVQPAEWLTGADGQQLTGADGIALWGPPPYAGLGDHTADDPSPALTATPAGVRAAIASGRIPIWDSLTTATMRDRARYTCHIADFCAPSDTEDRTAELRRWLQQAEAAGVRAVLGNDGRQPVADYVTLQELEITRAGQIVEFSEWGGYAYGDEDPRGVWQRGTRLVAAGDWFATTGQRRRTRRLHRSAAEDPDDAPLSAVLNVQAEGVTLIRPVVWQDCDYSDLSPTSLGVPIDCGIFIGTRVAVKLVQPMVIGYFRRAGIYLDVTGDDALPRHLAVDGSRYPTGTVRNGSDGFRMEDPYIIGGRVGLAVLGGRPAAGSSDNSVPYFDAEMGLNTDRRGSFGASDLLVTGGRIFGPEHHSGRRLHDPVRIDGVLSQASMDVEPDDAPAAVYLDGLAGNSSTNIWGMRFIGTRISSWEAFRMRLRQASRVALYSCHMEGRGWRMDTAGNPMNANDYDHNSYGDIAATEETTRVLFLGAARTSLETNGLGPHFYGTSLTYLLDNGELAVGSNIRSNEDELDISGKVGLRFRAGIESIGVLNGDLFQTKANVFALGFAGSSTYIISSAGNPEGVETAPLNSICFNRAASGLADWMFRKASGTGNTGWVAIFGE